MGLIITLILGGLAGWIASKIMNTDADQGVLMNIAVGIIGAILANLFIAPIFGYQADLSGLSLIGFIFAIFGAIVLLAIVNLFTRRQIR